MNEHRPARHRLPRLLSLLTAIGTALSLLLVAAVIGWHLLGKPEDLAVFRPARRSEPVPMRPVTPRGNLADSERATIELFKARSPSVVFITTLAVQRDFFSLDVLQIPRGNGSGFIWDDSGHVVTNLHVIENADAARITLHDGSTYEAKLVGHAAEKDLAVLRIDAPPDTLRPIPVGRSNDLVVGQSVFAIGNPFGLDHTLSKGVISGLGREIPGASGVAITGLIQTDAAINPGNSGGPLLDSSGRLIGVNTAIYSPTGANAGVGFAIPVDVVNSVVPQLVRFGRIVRPRIGVRIADDSLIRRMGLRGVLVLGVEAGSPAERAGLRGTTRSRSGRIVLGDLLVGMDGQPVRDSADLFRQLEKYDAGDTTVIRIVRDGSEREAKVTLSPGN
jgi:S1-C subfamily serine protease